MGQRCARVSIAIAIPTPEGRIISVAKSFEAATAFVQDPPPAGCCPICIAALAIAACHRRGMKRRLHVANARNAAVRDALVSGASGPALPAKRLLLAPWEPGKGAQATGHPGVYVELQDAG